MTSRLDEARAALQIDVFGYDDFRPGQAEVIRRVLAGEDVFAVMPTGSGKSMCYQLPALVDGALTVVVSPLIALMRDQVQQMRGSASPPRPSTRPTPRRRATRPGGSCARATAAALRLARAACSRRA